MIHETFSVAEVEVTYKPDYKVEQRPKITTSKQAHELFLQHWHLGKIAFLEEFKMILLNRRNRVLGIVDISMGGVSGTFVDAKVIFAIALKANSSSLILCHNHPSGELKPSQQDISLTERLRQGGKLLNIEICDHLIISEDGYYSMAENCLMG